MTYDEFFAMATSRGVHIATDIGSQTRSSILSNEALFQLPFLAMVILVLAKGNRKPAPQELGQLVGECLERAVAGFRESPQGIGWSANLRIRTVKALTFLETANLVEIGPPRRRVALTEFGRKVVDQVFSTENQLAFALATIERSYQNITSELALQSRLL